MAPTVPPLWRRPTGPAPLTATTQRLMSLLDGDKKKTTKKKSKKRKIMTAFPHSSALEETPAAAQPVTTVLATRTLQDAPTFRDIKPQDDRRVRRRRTSTATASAEPLVLAAKENNKDKCCTKHSCSNRTKTPRATMNCRPRAGLPPNRPAPEKQQAATRSVPSSATAVALNLPSQQRRRRERYTKEAVMLRQPHDGDKSKTMDNVASLSPDAFPNHDCDEDGAKRDDGACTMDAPLPRTRPVNPQHRLEALQDIPRPADEPQQTNNKKESPPKNDNFVRLNLRNGAGACRGARNKKTKRKKRTDFKQPFEEQQQQQSLTTATTTPLSSFSSSSAAQGNAASRGVDPMDDFLDGVFTAHKRNKSDALPKCSGHQRLCKLLVVKKNTNGNKGRSFYCCPLPRGEQCDYFAWADDTVEVRQSLACAFRGWECPVNECVPNA